MNYLKLSSEIGSMFKQRIQENMIWQKSVFKFFSDTHIVIKVNCKDDINTWKCFNLRNNSVKNRRKCF